MLPPYIGGAWFHPQTAGPVPTDGTWLGFALTTTGIVVCGLSVHACGTLVARRDVVEAGAVPAPAASDSAGMVRRGLRAFETVVAPSLLLGGWAMALAVGVLVLAPPFDAGATSLVVVAIAAAVRVTTYYREGLSELLATMLPAAVFGVVILDRVAARSLGSAAAAVTRLAAHRRIVAYGLLSLLLIELSLRAAWTAVERYDSP